MILTSMLEMEQCICVHKMDFMSLISLRLVYLNMLSKKVKCGSLDFYKQEPA